MGFFGTETSFLKILWGLWLGLCDLLSFKSFFMVQVTRLYNLLSYLVDTYGRFHCTWERECFFFFERVNPTPFFWFSCCSRILLGCQSWREVSIGITAKFFVASSFFAHWNSPFLTDCCFSNVGVHVSFYIEHFIPKLVPGKYTLSLDGNPANRATGHPTPVPY